MKLGFNLPVLLRNVRTLLFAQFPVAAFNATEESAGWRIRCLSCDASRSVWEVGGVRYKAASIRKRKLAWCRACGGPRIAAVEWVPKQGPRQILPPEDPT